MSHIKSRAFAFLALCFCALKADAQIQCPQNCYSFGNFPAPVSDCFPDGPTFVGCPRDQFGIGGCVEYDLQQGTWRINAPVGSNIGGIRIILADDFLITGPAGPTPSPIVLHLDLGGELHAGGCDLFKGAAQTEVRVTETTTAVFSRFIGYCDGLSIADDLPLVIPHTAGQTFRVTIDVSAGAGFGTAVVTGSLRFELPGGYSITSCRGFTTATVGVQPSSWSRAKYLYRDSAR